jgi:hypothetical protein
MWRRRARWQRREPGGVRELVWALTPHGFSLGTLEISPLRNWHAGIEVLLTHAHAHTRTEWRGAGCQKPGGGSLGRRGAMDGVLTYILAY